jgi:hypothetical protein
MFNAGFLVICQCIFDNIQYFACNSSINCTRKNLKNSNGIKFTPIPVIGGKSKYFLPLRYLFSGIIDIVLLLITGQSIIIYYRNNVFSISLINTINKVLKKKIIIICHGEFELLNKDSRQRLGLLAKTMKIMATRFYLNQNIQISKNLYFIVLGDKILDNLKSLLPMNITEKIFSMELPYIYDYQKNKVTNRHHVLNLGTIGIVSKGKSIDNLIYLADVFHHEIENKDISLSIVGHILVNKQELLEAKINIAKNDSELERQEFDRQIEQLDYILFFYEKDNYRYTASGAIFDTINYEKPIIALKNDYFEYLFEKYYPIGYLVSSVDEMVPIIRNILVNKQRIKYPFDKIKKLLSSDMITYQFRNILESIK